MDTFKKITLFLIQHENIQELFGHKSSRTTEIYTHVSTQSLQKIKSLFDDL